MVVKAVPCRLMPANQDISRGRAQVVVYSGNGRSRRSCNRHVVRQGRAWVGNNPDNRVPGLHVAADAAVEVAQKELGKATTLLAEFGEISKRNKAYRDQFKLVKGLAALLLLAEQKKKEVEEEFPLRLQFEIRPETEF